MAAPTALVARSGWSVSSEIRWSLSRGIGGQFAPKSGGQYQRILHLDIIRRNKKFNFWMNSGTTKFSTIHSFKGWEVPTLFLIIEPNADENEVEFTSDELIYTAITRCRQNLIIINLGNAKYHTFFSKVII